MNIWVVVLIIGREFLISGLRSIAASEGFTIEASELGKLKMVVQIVSVVATILALRWDMWNFNLGFFRFIFDVDLVARMAIWFMVAVSVISAVDYFWGFWKKIDTRVERRRRRPFILSRRRKKALRKLKQTIPPKHTRPRGIFGPGRNWTEVGAKAWFLRHVWLWYPSPHGQPFYERCWRHTRRPG